MRGRLPAFSFLSLLSVAVGNGPLVAEEPPPRRDLESAAREAVSPDAAVAARGRATLRAAGPAGLATLLSAHAGTVSRVRSEGVLYAGEGLLRDAADVVARQRDALFSGLYWHTDLAKALRRAKAEGKPVLSLRLLGNLDEELSCANSRFFRTALYANEAVSKQLRDSWVLHWESVRPAPRITIDFGDGRVVERTITGNSAHLVLTSGGDVVDALPGLYGPGAFLRELEALGALAKDVAGVDPEARRRRLSEHTHAMATRTAAPVDSADARLDASSRALMRLKTRGVHDDRAFERTVESFERSIGEDTAQNEGVLRKKAHAVFALSSTWPLSASQATSLLYDVVLQTPRLDPWLGLVPSETYSGIEGEGLRVASGRRLLGTPPGSPSAAVAAPLAMSKLAVEMPLVRAVAPSGRTASRGSGVPPPAALASGQGAAPAPASER